MMKNPIKKLFNKNTTHGKILRLVFVVFILVAIIVIGCVVLKKTGLWEKVNSMEKIRKIVESGGAFSFVIFILLQILQTTILQIPSFFVTVAGALIFGNWPAFFMSYISIMIGSVIMFWIGRKAGNKFLNWIAGDDSKKWQDKMSHGKYLFFLMMLFPMFPDDILCVIAGMTNMSFSFFLITNIIARGIGVAGSVFFGSGSIIPFSGWGLYVWGIIVIFVVALFYFSVRYQDKLDQLFNQMFKKKEEKVAIELERTENVDSDFVEYAKEKQAEIDKTKQKKNKKRKK